MSKLGVSAKVSVVLLSFGSLALADERPAANDPLAFFENPVAILMPDGGRQTNCADPTVIRGQAGDPYWYALCTTDSLNDEDVEPSGARRSHLVPMLRSRESRELGIHG